MDDCLEDGEIVESDPEEKVIERPPCQVDLQDRAAASAQIRSAAAASFKTATSYRGARCPGLSSSEDEDDDYGHGASSSDDDYSRPSQKRSRCFAQSDGDKKTPFFNPLLAQKQKAGTLAETGARSDMQTSGNLRGAKPNSVWSSVLQEQTLTRTIGSFGVENDDHYKNSYRDVESYDYTKSRSDPRNAKPVANYETDMFDNGMQTKEEDSEPSEPEPQLEDVESFGLDVKPKPASAKLRLGKRRTKARESSQNNSAEEEAGKRQSALERLGSLDQSDHSSADMDDTDVNKVKKPSSLAVQAAKAQAKHTGNVQDRLGSHQPAAARKRKHKDKVHQRLGDRSYRKNTGRGRSKVTVDDPPEKVTQELMDVLEEPGYMEDLWLRIPEKLGNKLALELLHMTEDLEDNGGLWINDGVRRRTPGGVYLHLLKEASNIPEDEKRYIFDWDKKEKNKAKKALKKRATRRKHEKLQNMTNEAKQEMASGDQDGYLADLKKFAERKKRFGLKDDATDAEKKTAETKDDDMEDHEINDLEADNDPLDDLDMSGDADIVLELD